MKFARSLLLLSLVAACAPLSIYYRPGVSVARLDTDRTACEVSSLRDAPVANQIRENPPIFVPGRQVCVPNGACTTYPGYWRSGGFYTVDVNSGLRARLMDQCMGRKGYQPVTIPRCESAVAQAVPPGATKVLPKIDEKSCAVMNRDGTWQIVTTR
ncbi:hypothetical protein [Seohaeicola zhoushanensis]|nr:hypothetical protein [Seohaeicola zhoushanensis]